MQKFEMSEIVKLSIHLEFVSSLQRYCECFASGIFCQGCNCVGCFNNEEHKAERTGAIEATLERNPQAFRPKISQQQQVFFSPQSFVFDFLVCCPTGAAFAAAADGTAWVSPQQGMPLQEIRLPQEILRVFSGASHCQ